MSRLAVAPERIHAEDAPAPPAPTRLHPASHPDQRATDPLAFSGVAGDHEGDDTAEAPWPRLVWPTQQQADLPDPATWCGTLVRACAEALVGARPPSQLTRWLTPQLHSALGHHAVVGAGVGAVGGARRVRVLRVHLQEVDERRHEASVVLHDGRRVRAAAVRIELYRGRWRATALQIG